MTAPTDTADARPWGAFPQADGGTLFRLWAPDAPPGMTLHVEGHAALPTVPDGEGYAEWHVADCGPGTRYHYELADGTRLADPASRLQDGDIHDESIVMGPSSYEWHHPEWQPRVWEESVLYEVHVGLAGGFQGLRARLPELAALGINLIELMPIADFPGPRNWGYDGVLAYAPDRAYGSPHELQELIDSAHCLGIGVILDVVYNHFGPDGNGLPRYAGRFFREDRTTPWGPAIDFREPAVRRYFEDSAIHWLEEFRFDGLRLDAVHAIVDEDWLRALPRRLRARLPGRRIHLVIEDDANRTSLLDGDYDAQWNDDLHHVLHHLLTGEDHGYYGDYRQDAGRILARCLAEGWYYQGQPSEHHGGAPRGEPSGHLPPSAFIFFLQNHDQIGNRAWGERLSVLVRQPERLRAAIALQMLAPMVPLLFMGEEYASRAPFLYFTSHTDPALVQAVRDGRAREFANQPGFGESNNGIPDPNAETSYSACAPWPENGAHHEWTAFYARLLDLRAYFLGLRLAHTWSKGAECLGPAAALASWQLGDGAELRVYVNLAPDACAVSPQARPDDLQPWVLIFETSAGALASVLDGQLPGHCTVWVTRETP